MPTTQPRSSRGCPFTADLCFHEVGALLQLLESTRRSGTAVMRSAAGEASFSFRHGKLVNATAPRELPFGKLVLEAVALNGVDRPTTRAIAERATSTQLCYALQQVLDWKAGSFAFQPADDEGAEEDDSVEIDLQSLLMQAMQGAPRAGEAVPEPAPPSAGQSRPGRPVAR